MELDYYAFFTSHCLQSNSLVFFLIQKALTSNISTNVQEALKPSIRRVTGTIYLTTNWGKVQQKVYIEVYIDVCCFTIF